jgi:VWFA-related protein
VLRKLCLILLPAILVVPPSARAQTQAQALMPADLRADNTADVPPDGIPIIRSSVQEVNVIFAATDKKGRYRRDVKADDLAILDNGKAPAALRSFRSETDLPLRVGLVMDVSTSVAGRYKFEQNCAIEFFNHVLRRQRDQAFVVTFDSLPIVTQDFTDDPDLLTQGVKKLPPGGDSAVYDALYTAATTRFLNVQADGPVRRVIILISDGQDNHSRMTVKQVAEASRRAEVTIYTISTNTTKAANRGDKLLKSLAEETGGRAYFGNKSEKDVLRAFDTIQDELRSQYALSYKPADFKADGRYRQILIQPRKDKNLIIRARKGYFAPSR